MHPLFFKGPSTVNRGERKSVYVMKSPYPGGGGGAFFSPPKQDEGRRRGSILLVRWGPGTTKGGPIPTQAPLQAVTVDVTGSLRVSVPPHRRIDFDARGLQPIWGGGLACASLGTVFRSVFFSRFFYCFPSPKRISGLYYRTTEIFFSVQIPNLFCYFQKIISITWRKNNFTVSPLSERESQRIGYVCQSLFLWQKTHMAYYLKLFGNIDKLL